MPSALVVMNCDWVSSPDRPGPSPINRKEPPETIARILKSFTIPAFAMVFLVAVPKCVAQSYTQVSFPNAFDTQALSINAGGQVVGEYIDAVGAHGFRLSQGTFTAINVPNAALTEAQGINDNADIVGTFADDNGLHGFLLSNGQFTSIDVPGGTGTQARGISSKGDIVGQYTDSRGEHGFVLSHGAFRSIDVPQATSTVAAGVNSLLQVAGIYNDAHGQHGFLLSGTRITTIDFPSATGTAVLGINDSSRMVGQYIGGGGISHGFLLGAAGFVGIDFPGASATSACGVDQLGNVVGYYHLGSAFFGFRVSGLAGSAPQLSTLAIATGDQQTGSVGHALPNLLVVKTTNPNGSASSGISISFAITRQPQRAAGALSTTTATTGPDGTASTHLTLGDTPGPYQVTASCTGGQTCTPNSVTFTETAILPPTLVDPVPHLLSGPAVSTSTDVLASGGRLVQGVAADGVTQIVLRVPTANVGDQLSLTLLNDQGIPSTSPDEDGALGNPGDTTFLQTNLSVTAVNTTSGPMAFAIYRAPKDFPRFGGQDDNAQTRAVSIQVQLSTGSALPPVSIDIVRPPVILVHGIWSSAATWSHFCPHSPPLGPCATPLAPPFQERVNLFRINYAATSGEGFVLNAGMVFTQIMNYLDAFKNTNQAAGGAAPVFVAAVQVDAVAHSMGGDIVRAMILISSIPKFVRNENFKKGDVHKLITIDTPHFGSAFAKRLLESDLRCKLAFSILGNKPVGGAVADLAVGSAALQALQATILGLPVHVVVGIASTQQAVAAETNAISSGLTRVCPSLLPSGGFQAVFGGASDLIVSESSQEAQGLSSSGSPPKTSVSPIIHAVDTSLFTLGPDALSRIVVSNQVIGAATGIPESVIHLLNQPVYGPAFDRIRP